VCLPSASIQFPADTSALPVLSATPLPLVFPSDQDLDQPCQPTRKRVCAPLHKVWPFPVPATLFIVCLVRKLYIKLTVPYATSLCQVPCAPQLCASHLVSLTTPPTPCILLVPLPQSVKPPFLACHCVSGALSSATSRLPSSWLVLPASPNLSPRGIQPFRGTRPAALPWQHRAC
jgi:hypothetical protein